jgi:hypothetical protein
MAVSDEEAGTKPEEEDLEPTEIVESTMRVRERPFEEMLYAIGDSLSNLGSFDNKENGEDEADDKENSELGKLCNDYETHGVTDTISKTV